MKANSNLIGFGLFFIVFGAVLLGVRQGWIPTAVAERTWQLWPVLLIAAGLSIVLARQPGRAAGRPRDGGLPRGDGRRARRQPGPACRSAAAETRPASPFARESGELPDGAQVERQVPAAVSWRSTPRTAAAGPSKARPRMARPPTIRRDGDDITVEAAESGRVFGISGARERWNITLPTDPTIDLDVELNAGSGRLTLPGAHLGVGRRHGQRRVRSESICATWPRPRRSTEPSTRAPLSSGCPTCRSRAT